MKRGTRARAGECTHYVVWGVVLAQVSLDGDSARVSVEAEELGGRRVAHDAVSHLPLQQ